MIAIQGGFDDLELWLMEAWPWMMFLVDEGFDLMVTWLIR
jgi:hypothetical protein